MYRSMLFLHWKQIRLALIPFAMVAFGLPLMAIEGLGTPPGMESTSLRAYQFMNGFQDWLPMFPALAVAIGVTLALSAWNWDHQLKHVYALSLPLNRWEYTTAKFVAGAALALVPAAGMWLGAHAAATVEHENDPLVSLLLVFARDQLMAARSRLPIDLPQQVALAKFAL